MNNTNSQSSKETRTMDCPRCGGRGHFPEFSGIYQGTCFQCNGKGQVAYRASKAVVRELNAAQIKLIETVKTADFSQMSYAQLNTIRNAAHWPIPQCPELLSIWRERGDPFFFAAQERRLAELYANR